MRFSFFSDTGIETLSSFVEDDNKDDFRDEDGFVIKDNSSIKLLIFFEFYLFLFILNLFMFF